MNAVERIEKGLDRKGLMKLNNDFDSATNDYRGLIYIEAKKDCSCTSMSWEKYLDGFIVDGKQISVNYANRLIVMAKEQEELASANMGKIVRSLTTSLGETEAKLHLPKEPAVQMELRGDNAIEKARNYKEIQEVLDKAKPSGHEIRAFNKAKREAKAKYNEFKKDKSIKTLPKPDAFSYEEELDFESWCLKVKDFDVLAERPKQTKAIYSLKDDKVASLFNRLDEWNDSKVYKTMTKLCHPDVGGSSVAMSFLSEFNELMSSLNNIRKIVEYDNKVDELRSEYSSSSK